MIGITALNQQTDQRTNQSPHRLSDETAESLSELRRRLAQTATIPKVIQGREQGIESGWPGFDIRTLLVGEESAGRFAVHDVILSPGAGFSPYHLVDTDVYWYVLEGELEVTVGNLTGTLTPDGFGFVPQSTTQAIRNRTLSPVRLFLWSSPAGLERAFEEVHRQLGGNSGVSAPTYETILAENGFVFHTGEVLPNDAYTNRSPPRLEATVNEFEDFVQLRERWTQQLVIPKLVYDRGSCGDIPLPGQDTKVLLSGDEAGGRAVVFHYGINPGYTAPPHHQRSEEEIFLMVDGELELSIGNTTEVIRRGAFGFAPRHATHGFHNASSREARCVTINSPGGHERGFEMLVREGPSERLLPLIYAHGWQLHDLYTPPNKT